MGRRNDDWEPDWDSCEWHGAYRPRSPHADCPDCVREADGEDLSQPQWRPPHVGLTEAIRESLEASRED